MSRSATPDTIVLTMSLFLCLVSTPSLTHGATGRVEVRVTDHRAGIGDFTAFQVALAVVSLHRRGQPHRQAWVEVVRHTPPVDIVPLKHGRWATIGAGAIEAGRYDAARVRFGSVRGVLRSGTLAEVAAHGSAVTVDLTVVPGTTLAMVIDLYVEDQREHRAGGYVVKIQAIRVTDR